MIRIRILLIFLLIAGTCTISCSQFRTITIENRHPAKKQVSDDIQSLTLMNRSMTPEFCDFDEDSLQLYFYRKQFDVKTNVLDSAASDTCLKAIGELLYESGRFDIVIPVERNIPRESKYYLVDQPLDWDYVENICKTYNTDALLVMERYINKVNTSFEASPLYSNGQSGYTYFYASFDIIYNSFFRIYDPAKKEIAGQFFISDTIFWENEDADQRQLFTNLTSIKQGLIDAGIQVALDLDDYISPLWIPESRGLFVIDKKNDTEQKLINENDWTGLAKYWFPLTKSSKQNIKSKAEFNMALASELDGRIDDAIEWASKSYQTAYRNQTDMYLKQLKSRKAELLKFEQASKNTDN